MHSQGVPFLLEETFPGIPNDVTFAHITTKLPWSDLNNLLCVSTSWKQAIESREAYNWRVLSGSTETLVGFSHKRSKDGGTMSLYSAREKAFYELPRFPFRDEIPPFSQIVSKNGRIFVLVSARKDQGAIKEDVGGKLVLVFDVAGKRHWEPVSKIQDYLPPPCAAEKSAEKSVEKSVEKSAEKFFGCGVAVGDEIFWRTGHENWFHSTWKVYHSFKRERRLVEPSQIPSLEEMPKSHFLCGGKFHNITSSQIYVMDCVDKIWKHQHSVSSHEIGPQGFEALDPVFVLPVNNELFAIVPRTKDKSDGHFILQTRGFGTQNRQIVWEEISHSLEFEDTFFMFPIQL